MPLSPSIALLLSPRLLEELSGAKFFLRPCTCSFGMFRHFNDAAHTPASPERLTGPAEEPFHGYCISQDDGTGLVRHLRPIIVAKNPASIFKPSQPRPAQAEGGNLLLPCSCTSLSSAVLPCDLHEESSLPVTEVEPGISKRIECEWKDIFRNILREFKHKHTNPNAAGDPGAPDAKITILILRYKHKTKNRNTTTTMRNITVEDITKSLSDLFIEEIDERSGIFQSALTDYCAGGRLHLRCDRDHHAIALQNHNHFSVTPIFTQHFYIRLERPSDTLDRVVFGHPLAHNNLDANRRASTHRHRSTRIAPASNHDATLQRERRTATARSAIAQRTHLRRGDTVHAAHGQMQRPKTRDLGRGKYNNIVNKWREGVCRSLSWPPEEGLRGYNNQFTPTPKGGNDIRDFDRFVDSAYRMEGERERQRRWARV